MKCSCQLSVSWNILDGNSSGLILGVYERWQTAPELVRYLTSLEYESNHLSSLSEREYYFPCYGTGESASFNLICLIVKSGIYLDKALETSTNF